MNGFSFVCVTVQLSYNVQLNSVLCQSNKLIRTASESPNLQSNSNGGNTNINYLVIPLCFSFLSSNQLTTLGDLQCINNSIEISMSQLTVTKDSEVVISLCFYANNMVSSTITNVLCQSLSASITDDNMGVV